MIRTRIAPSPTGQDVHVGTVATGLMNYAWAKKNNGKFVIRIEDTDRSRLVPGGEERMLTTLESLGLVADESPLAGGPFAPYRQSERLPLYKKYAEELIAKGKAYYCTCSAERLDEMRKQQQQNKQVPKYDRHCLNRQEEVKKEIEEGAKFVVRMLMPDEKISFTDTVRGTITIDGGLLDDQVILKSDGFPTYHLAVVVDDHLMEITHVIRGEEWMPSTPKHVVLYRALGWELPQYTHVSLMRNPDKSKLSKRKNPVWASDYLNRGILREALLNYLALMGWSHPDGKDIFTLDEYISLFDIKDLQTTAPVFDPVKLEWMNGEYIRMMNPKRLAEMVYTYFAGVFSKDLVEKTIPLVQERIKTLKEYESYCLFFKEQPSQYEISLGEHQSMLKAIGDELASLDNWSSETIGTKMVETAEKLGVKNSIFFMVLRVAITGKKVTPPLNDSMAILGKEECIARIARLIM
ncbi:glutamate--tRNA ligase [Candidatus Roizmanbacteria bacterium]|nr:glutamate--tRNA ligase [Candidatus Roizmanbacteria bacterium]